jgi:hypothetical protein
MDSKLVEWLCRPFKRLETTTNLTDSLLVLSAYTDQYRVKVSFIYKDNLYHFSSYDGQLPTRFLEADSEPLRFTKGYKLLEQNEKLNSLLIKWSHRIDLPRKNKTVFF